MTSSIKDFEIINKIGEGAFSCVYKVRRISDNKFYAMKKVKMSMLAQKEKENALNEVRILASLDSPYIIKYNDSFIDYDSNILCVIMEFALGGDLNKILEEGRKKGMVPEEEIWNVLVQMSLGIKTLHDLGILHRDLKLANVFIQKSNEGNIYKIGDLNISKVTHGANAKTQAGTPYYAAPEVWKGEQYTGTCDIWSLGCIIYELAALKPPFRANDLQSLSKKIQQGVYDPLPQKYSKDLITIISMLLQVTPKNRPTSNQILNNPIVIKNSKSLLVESEQNGVKKIQLLKTIALPKNLQLLKGNLPKAKYDEDQKSEKGVRASSAGPKREPESYNTPQPEKNKVNQVQQQQQLQEQQQKQQQQANIQAQKQSQPPLPVNQKQPSQMYNKPPVQQSNQQKPPIGKDNNVNNKQQQAIQDPKKQVPSTPTQQQRNKLYGNQPSPRQNQQYMQYQHNQPAGKPSGGMQRIRSAQPVGRR